METLMEQNERYLLPANATRKIFFFVLAVTSRLLLFSSAASRKVISAAGIPLSSLSYKYEKQNIHSSVTVQFLTLL